MARNTTYANAILEAMQQAMAYDNNVITFGLGVDDPKAIFGTTKGLQEQFGSNRVFDMPAAENAMTGVAIGAALNGSKPVMVHQRLDFFLLAMDQLVNSAAKWHFMFGGQFTVPITIRLIVGRGWGQGPTHSQSLHAWFSHIPGLKVVMPASASDAKGLLLSSIFDPNPVVYIEHRWLHNTKDEVNEAPFIEPIGKGKLICKGDDITIVASSIMTVEARYATDFLKQYGVNCDFIDLRTICPIDWNIIFKSVKKTGRILVLDQGNFTGSIAGEIIAKVASNCWDQLRCAPERIAMPDYPESTSISLTKDYHPRAEHIVDRVAQMIGRDIDSTPIVKNRLDIVQLHDIPGDWFTGPF